MRSRAFAQAAAVLACTVAVSFFSGVYGRPDEVLADPAEDTVSEQEDAQNLTAGVTALLSNIDEMPGFLSAGVADAIMDCSIADVNIAETEKAVVTASQDESIQTQAEPEPEDEAVTDPSEWGYDELGIANVKECLNVREKPSTDSDIVGKMTAKNACEIEKVSKGWAKITSGEVKGYVKAEYLLTGDAAVEAAQGEIETYATVTTSTLRVRKKASTDAKVLSLVAKGEDLSVLNQDTEGWVKVQVDNEEGYVSADYVELGEKLPTAQKVTEVKEEEGVSASRVNLVSNALQYVGNPYKWGGTSLTNGVDCSGFTMMIYAQYGISLPHSSRAQPSYGTKIDSSEAQPGDLFFYGSGSSINHVAIYIGNGKIVHASNKKDGIKVSNAFYRSPICVVRYLK